MTTAEMDFATFVQQRFGGKLMKGSHIPNGRACLHEAISVYQGREWSDDTSNTIDLRSLNDAPWSSDEARTEAMVPLGSIVLAWPQWTPERRQAWAKVVAEGVIRRILPPTLRALAEAMPNKAPELMAAALRCETDGTESAAESAARAARAAARSAESAARSAESAARSAESAARSAESAARSAESAGSAAWSAESAARSAESAGSAADAPLQELCRIMLKASAATEGR
jgi:hypothetical protein